MTEALEGQGKARQLRSSTKRGRKECFIALRRVVNFARPSSWTGGGMPNGMRDAGYEIPSFRIPHPASRIPYPASRRESLGSAKNPARHLRLELRRMAGQFLSG